MCEEDGCEERKMEINGSRHTLIIQDGAKLKMVLEDYDVRKAR